MDTGLLILRVVVGMLMMGHGAQKLFGWFHGHGPEGTGGFFEQLGYKPGKPMAMLAGATEAGSGLLLVIGLLAPLAGAALIGVMLSAARAHRNQPLWVSEGGAEYPLVLATIGAAFAFTGFGEASLDHALGWNLSGTDWGIAALAVGLVSGGALRAYAANAERQRTGSAVGSHA